MNALKSWRWLTIVLVCVSWSLAMSDTAHAQRKKPTKEAAADEPAVEMLQYTVPREIEMQIGLRVIAADGALSYMTATTVFPTEWPETKG